VTTKRAAIGPASLTSVRTRGVPIGALRWILPVALFVGLLTGLVGLLLGQFGRKPSPTGRKTGRFRGQPGPT
jgi:thiamine transporter ThiT